MFSVISYKNTSHLVILGDRDPYQTTLSTKNKNKKQKIKGTSVPQNNNLLAISSTKTNVLSKEIRKIYLLE